MPQERVRNGHHRICKLRVVGGFLDGLDIEFTDNLNCIIGGRGTGKTTVIELLRWTLDQTPKLEDRARKLGALVAKNLGSGQVLLEIQTQDGVKYRVRRDRGTAPIVLDEEGNPAPVDLGRGSLFAAEVYSQDEIVEIAEDPMFQLNLLDKSIAGEVRDVGERIDACVRNLDTNAAEVRHLREETLKLKDAVAQLPEITERLKPFSSVGAGQGASELQKEGQRKRLRELETRCVDRLYRLCDEARRSLEAAVADLPRHVAESFSQELMASDNGGLLREIKSTAEGGARDALRHAQASIVALQTARAGLTEKAAELQALHAKQEARYRELLAREDEEREKCLARDELLKTHTALAEQAREYEEHRTKLRQKEEEREKLLRLLSDLRDERYGLRSGVADRLTKELSPGIRVRVEQYGNLDSYRMLLMDAMKGAGFRYAQVVDRVVQRLPPSEFVALVRRADADQLMDELELDAEKANRLLLHLQDHEDLFRIEIVELHDRPVIELQDGKRYKASSELSAGQKCTAILPILLLESPRPLLIDQPEDNLDNAYIYETVVATLRRMSGRRQLIFVTHNPNIPVLGDAERVFVLQSDGTRADLKRFGSVNQAKDDIETILEGGREAFLKRKQRYGH